jgi:two-component system OmpR family response regulator
MAVDYRKVDVFSAENREVLPVYPLDVFHTTEKGEAEVHSSATTLPSEVLELLVAVDGKANVGDIEHQLQHIPPETVRTLLRMLMSDGLLRQPTVEEEMGLDLSSFLSGPAAPAAPSEGAKASADREAGHSVAALQGDGYYVSIAHRSAGARKHAPGEKPTVLLVDDDPDFCALVERLLSNAGFGMRIARNRTEIVAELTKAPLPDLVLLDVNLPGTNGFEILQKMKQVPALKGTPVIMTTAEANRASVMKGLIGGADGYITKPFRNENLLKGVRTVLGLE